MATPESIASAFARGLVEAMLATGVHEPKLKKERPVVVKTDMVKEAVREYIDQLTQQEEQPEQQDLFAAQSVDMGEAILRRVEEARARIDARDEDEPEPGTYRPDTPGEGTAWQSPIA